VLGDQSVPADGGLSLAIRSYYEPTQSLTTTVIPEASPDAAVAAFNALSATYPTSNKVLGRIGTGYQNDGTAGVGEQSTLLESPAQLVILWVKDNYLMELDDSTGEGQGQALVRAQDVEGRLENLLGSS